MLHSLAFILALIISPTIVVFGLQRIIKPNGPHLPISFTSVWHFLAIAAAILGVIFSHAFTNPVSANFFMHAIGGGVVSFCLTIHVLRQLNLRLTIWQLGLVVLAAVCVLGVANELFEFLLELLFPGKLLFSWDTHDTWRDLTANLVGSLASYGVFSSVKAFLGRHNKCQRRSVQSPN